MTALLRTRPAILALATAVGAAGSVVGVAVADPGGNGGGAGAAPGQRVIKDRYIVMFRPSEAPSEVDAAGEDAKRDGAQIHFRYRRAANGFAATLPARAVERLRQNPRVTLLEPDQEVFAGDTQPDPPWGLDRIDQRLLPLSLSFTYGANGQGVRAYVIDTGIRATHSDFGGRVVPDGGFTSISDGRGTGDCNGHGTHVAGTLGGSRSGVAKAVQLVPVRVLNCQGSGSTSGVIAGIDFVTTNHLPGQPAVANMSLGGGYSSALNTAVANSVADGVTYAVAAGNENANACNASPASAPSALTVGATTASDARAAYSNVGSCVDLFAPGSGIQSAWHTSDTAYNTISGTSMASPHVAGVAALYLQGNPSAGAAQVAGAVIGAATQNVVGNPGSGSPDRLLHSDLSPVVPTPVPTTVPTPVPTTVPTPTPTPVPSACTSYPDVHTGALSPGGSAFHPPGSSYTNTVAGVHRGCLDGPAGTDFDLYLERRSLWGSWSAVASATSPAPDETIAYNAPAGTYRWRVRAYSGSGPYTFGVRRP